MVHSTSLRASGCEVVCSMLEASSAGALWTMLMAPLTAVRSRGEVALASAKASGGPLRTGAVKLAAGGGAAAGPVFETRDALPCAADEAGEAPRLCAVAAG